VKIVILVNNNLAHGVAANTCGIIGMTLGKLKPELIGPDIADGCNNIHRGISSYALPVLQSDSNEIMKIYTAIQKQFPEEIITVPFSQTAQTSKCYEEYEHRLSLENTEKIVFNGLGICGNKKILNRLTGHLKLF
jgi:hypothetical protein